MPTPTGLDPEKLSAVRLFEGLDDETLAALAGRCRIRRFAAGDTVLHHHEQSSELFFVLGGGVRVLLFSPSGRDVSFRDLSAGEVFGELAAIDGGPRSANVVSTGESELAVMSSRDFLELTHLHPAVSDALLRHLVALIRQYSQRVYELSTLGVEERIRLEILRLAWEHAGEDCRAVLRPAPTLAEFAGRVSTTREAVSREIARLAREGLVERDGHDLVITDVARLSGTVEEIPM